MKIFDDRHAAVSLVITCNLYYRALRWKFLDEAPAPACESLRRLARIAATVQRRIFIPMEVSEGLLSSPRRVLFSFFRSLGESLPDLFTPIPKPPTAAECVFGILVAFEGTCDFSACQNTILKFWKKNPSPILFIQSHYWPKFKFF